MVDGGKFHGTDITPLHFRVAYETADRVRMTISDPAMQRYEVPEKVLPFPPVDESVKVFNYNVTYTGTCPPCVTPCPAGHGKKQHQHDG